MGERVLSVYGGMFCPPRCPECFATLHPRHAMPGAPPCHRCGHEHAEGLTFDKYQRAEAAWSEPKCTACGLSLDEVAKWFADRLCAACSRSSGRIVELKPDSSAAKIFGPL